MVLTRHRWLRLGLTLLLVLAAVFLCAWELSAQEAPSTPAKSNSVWTQWRSFGLDRVPGLQYRPFSGIPLWQFAASLVYIFLSFALSRFADYLIGVKARQWARSTMTRLDDVLLELVRGPVKLVTFVVLLHIGIRVYAWPEALADTFLKVVKLVVAISVTYVMVKSVDVLLQLWRHRHVGADDDLAGRELLPLIRRTLQVFVVVVASLVTADNLGMNVTGIIASLSIGGLAVGLAAQDTLGNLFGAMAILMDKPFRVGDRIQVGSVDGFVETIGFRSTRVRNLDGHLVAIPNKEVGTATIVNIQLRPNIRTVMTFGLTYETSPEMVERATQVLRAVYSEHPKTQDVWISFTQFGTSSLNIQVIHWWADTDYQAYLAGMQAMNLDIQRRFACERIEFAFPTQTLWLKAQAGQVVPKSV